MFNDFDDYSNNEICKCGKSASMDDHTCPFREELNNDSESLCNCCANCQYECAMDV
jgi:hypothetical protein